LLRGRSGSSVRLRLQTADGERTRNLIVIRREVHIKSIPVAEILDGRHGIAYIQMNGFQKNTAAELDDALAKLRRGGMKTLVWDLRGNPGGLLTASVEVLDRFIDNGVLVSTRGRSRDQNWTYSAHRSQTWSVPIVLLVDGDSASASEIVAGAIRDHKRGVIVGRQTYGKWSVQSIFPMNDRMGLRLTTAKFYSPNGENYSKVGVKPHVVVEQAPKDLLRFRAPQTAAELQADTDLSKALELIRRRADRS
jgi:carboxyl-terminal processing protease